MQAQAYVKNTWGRFSCAVKIRAKMRLQQAIYTKLVGRDAPGAPSYSNI